MINDILKASESDNQLVRLLDEAREYAQVYLLAKQRQKGCDEMGEVATLKDEFKSLIDRMIEYCKTKNYVPKDMSYDIDLIAIEFEKMNKRYD